MAKSKATPKTRLVVIKFHVLKGYKNTYYVADAANFYEGDGRPVRSFTMQVEVPTNVPEEFINLGEIKLAD